MQQLVFGRRDMSPHRWIVPIREQPLTLAKRLRELRLAKGWSQKDMADMGFGQGTISRYENGEQEPSMLTVVRLEKAFGVKQGELVELLTQDKLRRALDEDEGVGDPSPTIPGPAIAIPDTENMRRLIRALDAFEDEQLPQVIHLIRFNRRELVPEAREDEEGRDTGS